MYTGLSVWYGNEVKNLAKNDDITGQSVDRNPHIPMQSETISCRKRTVFDSMYRSNLTLWSMRIAFGLLAILAIGNTALIAYGSQQSKPAQSVFRANALQ